MLMVKGYIAPSRIHGIGLFAAQDIPAGGLVWRFSRLTDLVISQIEYDEMPNGAREFLDKYGYRRSTGDRILCGDLSKFMNHSDDPTLFQNEEEDDFAARDILCGEELTADYKLFDVDSATKLDAA